MIHYQDNLEGISSDDLRGFFNEWPKPPSEEAFYKILENSSYIILAVDEKKVVGFVNAISDGVLSAYIPLLEVIPTHQKQGIGTILMKKMLNKLKDFYMVDLSSEENAISFYEKLGLQKATAMSQRNYNAIP